MSATRERRWTAVYAHRERLLRLSRARCDNLQDAEDCVQEAMLRCVEFANLDEDRLGQFLTSVTIRLCTDMHRHRSRGDRLSRRLAAFSAVDPGPEEAICDRAESAWLSTHVDTLPGRQREIVQLRAAGQSCAAVADQLRMSYAAIESALSRARRSLRVTLESTLGVVALPWSRDHRPRYVELGALGLGAAALTAVTFIGVTPGEPADARPFLRPGTGTVYGSEAAASAGQAAAARALRPAATGGALAGLAGAGLTAPGRGGSPGSGRHDIVTVDAGPGTPDLYVDEPDHGKSEPPAENCVSYGVEIYPRTGCQYAPGDPDRDRDQIGTTGIPRGGTS
jgi:RNA polymerase sigma factor (sigma-70 family)